MHSIRVTTQLSFTADKCMPQQLSTDKKKIDKHVVQFGYFAVFKNKPKNPTGLESSVLCFPRVKNVPSVIRN